MIQARKTRGRTIAPGLHFRRGDGRCSFAYVQIQIVRPRKNGGGESMAAVALLGGQWDARSQVLQRVLRVLSTPAASAANPGGKQRREVQEGEVGERISDGA
ncbi:hypothetical protein PS1_025891 [Malus domestica]